MKKYVIIIQFITVIILFFITGLMTDFLMDKKNTQDNVKIGEVKVSPVLFYEKNNINYSGTEIVIDPSTNIKKEGVYYVNVVDSDSIEFIENVRINIIVESNVATYFRVRIVEQMTLTTENYLGEKKEIPIIADRTLFNYSQNDWFFDNGIDGFYYYKNQVKEQTEGTPLTLNFISSYFEGVHYNTRPLGYSLQIGIKVEAVQAVGGAENNWGLLNPPWGGSW